MKNFSLREIYNNDKKSEDYDFAHAIKCTRKLTCVCACACKCDCMHLREQHAWPSHFSSTFPSQFSCSQSRGTHNPDLTSSYWTSSKSVVSSLSSSWSTLCYTKKLDYSEAPESVLSESDSLYIVYFLISLMQQMQTDCRQAELS